jgi:hypothetical protein
MVRAVSICLIIALAVPPLARGKCLCPDPSPDTDLPPCCRASVQSQVRSHYGCCSCHQKKGDTLVESATTDQRRAAAISNDCECGRLKLIQSGWRWSPRRELPRQDEFEVFFHGSAVVLWTSTQRGLISPARPHVDATGPPLHIWHCVWLI